MDDGGRMNDRFSCQIGDETSDRRGRQQRNWVPCKTKISPMISKARFSDGTRDGARISQRIKIASDQRALLFRVPPGFDGSEAMSS